MSEQADVVIIGGGIAGIALAHELSQRKARRIVILEERRLGYGGTSRNIGRIRTSQFSEPLARFAKDAFRKHAQLSRELKSNTLFWMPGYALVFYDDAELEIIGSVQAMLAGLGQHAEFHEGPAVFRRLPVLSGGRLPVGCLIRPDASVHHDALLNAYKKSLINAGVIICEGLRAEAIEFKAGRVSGVTTKSGTIEAEWVVNAAGGWSREVSALAGLQVPNRPVRREAIVTEACQPFMDTMITFYRPVEGWFHQTLRGETVIGVTDPDEPLGMSLAATQSHLHRAAEQIFDKAPRLANLRVVRQWAGVYDMVPDRKPLVEVARTHQS
jgi:sarcosine oxidase subunit beta